MKGSHLKKTLWSFAVAVLMALFLFVSIAASIHYGFTDLLGLTIIAKEALLCCKTLFSWCLVSPTMFRTVIPWVGLGIVTAGLAAASLRAGRALMVSRRFLRTLECIRKDRFPVLEGLARKYKIDITPFEDNLLKSAFTIGLSRPTVFVSTGLIGALSPHELKAVLLHEIHHAVNKDPLRLFIISFIKDALFFLPLGRYLMDSFYIQKELAADEGVAAITKRPFDLATALIKMVRMKHNFVPAGIPILEKGDFVKRRIKALLEPETKRERLPGKTALLTAASMAFLVAALVLPMYAGTKEMEKCNHDYCLSGERVCPNDMKDCKKACELMEEA